MPDYSEFESAADLCGGQQIDQTPRLEDEAPLDGASLRQDVRAVESTTIRKEQ